MPSRLKKALRDSALTRTFFGEPELGICPCCAGQAHNYAANSTNAADPDHADSESNTEMFRTIMSSLWSERYKNLTTEERQGIHAAVEMQPEIADPHRVLQALKLAHKQMCDVSAMADGFSTMETFDLDNLDEVAKEYDELCQKCKDEEESKMANLSGLVSNSASIASDTTRSAKDRLAAELDIHNFNIHSKVIVPLTSCLRQVQLFNVEKKFGFVEESYQALGNDDRKRRGEDAPAELPLTFRQKLNNPFKPAKSAPKPSIKKEKKDISSLKALAELRRSYKATIKEIQNINKSISDAEDSIKPPSVAPSFTYADVPVPKDIPDHIRQRFLDAEYSFNEVLVLQEDASKQLTDVRSAFVAWYSASHEVWYVSPKVWGHETLSTEKLVWLCDTTLGLLWCKDFLLTQYLCREAGKKHVHEMPLFRKYEYTRNSLHAMFSVASRQEVKIVEFYSSEGAPKLPLAMNKAFRLNSMSLQEFEKDWVRKLHGDLSGVCTKPEKQKAKAQFNP